VNGNFSSAPKKKPRDRPLLKLKKRASRVHRMNTRVADGRPLSREGRVGCRALCTNVPGPSLEPVLQFPLCNASSVGARAPKFFNRGGGVFRESPVRSTWKFHCWRCEKTVVGVCGWAQNAKSICIYLTTKPVAIPSESFATLGSKRTVSNSTTTLRAALN